MFTYNFIWSILSSVFFCIFELVNQVIPECCDGLAKWCHHILLVLGTLSTELVSSSVYFKVFFYPSVRSIVIVQGFHPSVHLVIHTGRCFFYLSVRSIAIWSSRQAGVILCWLVFCNSKDSVCDSMFAKRGRCAMQRNFESVTFDLCPLFSEQHFLL